MNTVTPKGKVSVVSITFNNPQELERTLISLATIRYKPYEIIIVDGGSCQKSPLIVRYYRDKLPIQYIKEQDNGVYDAMNKGKAKASGNLIHYLNSGDSVYGEPYKALNYPCLLPVRLFTKNDSFIGYAHLTIAQHSYCHQGVILPAQHKAYDTHYKIAAELVVLLDSFRNMRDLTIHTEGGANYFLTGISSTNRLARDKEIAHILWHKKRYLLLIFFLTTALTKTLIPQKMRRLFFKKKH